MSSQDHDIAFYSAMALAALFWALMLLGAERWHWPQPVINTLAILGGIFATLGPAIIGVPWGVIDQKIWDRKHHR